MENNNTPSPFDNLFATLHLDNRASKEEVELAYEVLTRKSNSIPYSILQDYRLAYETLMIQFFGQKGEKMFEKELYMTEDEHFKNINDNIVPNFTPKNVQKASKNLKKKHSWSEKARALLSIQNINLTLFFDNIEKHCHRLFGRKFWTESDINSILTDSTLRPIEFATLYWTFEKMVDGMRDQKIVQEEIATFCNNLKKYFSHSKYTCKIFEVDNLLCGVQGHCVLETTLAQQFLDMLVSKVQFIKGSYSVSSDVDLDEIDEQIE